MALLHAVAITAALFSPAAVAARAAREVASEARISSAAAGFTLRTELPLLSLEDSTSQENSRRLQGWSWSWRWDGGSDFDMGDFDTRMGKTRQVVTASDTGSAGDEGDEGNEGNEGDEGDEGNEGNEGNEGDEGGSDGGNTDGDEGDEGNEGNEGNEGDEGDEGNEGNEGDEGDEGNEGNEGGSPAPNPPSNPPPASTPPSTPPPSSSKSGSGMCGDPMVKQMVSNDNTKRSSPLSCDQKLGSIAYDWSQGQCRARKMSHDGFSGRCDAAGYPACGENVAYNKPPQLDITVDDTHSRWMNSDGHRKNIQNTGFNAVGYGWYVCDDDRLYWTGFFGKAPN